MQPQSGNKGKVSYSVHPVFNSSVFVSIKSIMFERINTQGEYSPSLDCIVVDSIVSNSVDLEPGLLPEDILKNNSNMYVLVSRNWFKCLL